MYQESGRRNNFDFFHDGEGTAMEGNRDHFFDHVNVTVKTRVVDHHQSYQVPETGWWFNDVIVFEYWGDDRCDTLERYWFHRIPG